MSVALTHRMKQFATVFKRDGYDDFGQPKLSEGTNIKCRWESTNDMFRDDQGEEFIAKSVIYPDRYISIGSFVAYGKDGDVSDAHEVRFSGSSPSMDGTKINFKVAL